MTDDESRMPDRTRNARETRECLSMALDEARELVSLREKDIRRCLDDGLSWSHPTVRTHRVRLAAVLADVQVLDRMLRSASAVAPSAPIPPLTTRR